jgi:hypothetical protein
VTPQELKSTIIKLGMSQVATAKAVGIDPSTMRRYISGALVIPLWLPLALNSLRKPPPRSRTAGTGSTVADETKSLKAREIKE